MVNRIAFFPMTMDIVFILSQMREMNALNLRGMMAQRSQGISLILSLARNHIVLPIDSSIPWIRAYCEFPLILCVVASLPANLHDRWSWNARLHADKACVRKLLVRHKSEDGHHARKYHQLPDPNAQLRW
jgi:hypothetical protein